MMAAQFKNKQLNNGGRGVGWVGRGGFRKLVLLGLQRFSMEGLGVLGFVGSRAW